MSPTRPIPDAQSRAFRLAVCERLGVDPAIVSENDFNILVGDEGLGEVTLTAFLPADELMAMFNAAGRQG